MKTTKAIEKLALQLYAVRATIKRFQESEKEIANELRPSLALDEPLVFSGIKLELVHVSAHSVAGYEVKASDKITVGPSAVVAGPNLEP